MMVIFEGQHMFIFRSKTPIFYLLIFLAKKKFLFYLLIPFTLQVVSDDGKRVKRLQSFTVSDMQDLQVFMNLNRMLFILFFCKFVIIYTDLYGFFIFVVVPNSCCRKSSW